MPAGEYKIHCPFVQAPGSVLQAHYIKSKRYLLKMRFIQTTRKETILHLHKQNTHSQQKSLHFLQLLAGEAFGEMT